MVTVDSTTLNAGQVYVLRSTSDASDPAGTLITADRAMTATRCTGPDLFQVLVLSALRLGGPTRVETALMPALYG